MDSEIYPYNVDTRSNYIRINVCRPTATILLINNFCLCLCTRLYYQILLIGGKFASLSKSSNAPGDVKEKQEFEVKSSRNKTISMGTTKMYALGISATVDLTDRTRYKSRNTEFQAQLSILPASL